MGKKILVVGGVAGGASFSARMRRLDENAQIVMFEKGEHISFANCGLPYHIGEVILNRDDLLIQTPSSFSARFNVDVRVHTEVTAVSTADSSVTVRGPIGQETIPYDYLVLAPGCAPMRPPIPGINHERICTLRNIADMDRIKQLVDKGLKRTVVIGGGFIGLEMAESLRHRGCEVVMIELSDQVFMPADKEMAAHLHQHLLLNGIDLRLSAGAQSFSPREDGGVDVHLSAGAPVPADLVILAIGVKPDTAFCKESGIALTERGAVVVDAHMRTNVPNVFAVGDAIEVVDFVSGKKVHVPLAGPANRQGRIVADNIAGKESVYRNTQGTAICKVFDLTAAVTGISEKTAVRLGIPFVKSYTHSSSHAGYYPGAFPMTLKILCEPTSGKLLGAQIIGSDGVDKRIDVLAVALRHGLTVAELTDLELAYAPPYGSAKDAVNMAGFVAENILDGTMPVCYAEDIAALDKKNTILLDVRTAAEFEAGNIEGAVNIPVDTLRKSLGLLDKNKEIIVYCQIGLRGHLATRILMQNGYRCKNLSGGYKTYKHMTESGWDASYLKPVTENSCSSPQGVAGGARKVVDARGLQCPGPIMKLAESVGAAQNNDVIEISATDQGFVLDIPSWCSRTRNTLVSLTTNNGVYTAVIKKGAPDATCSIPQNRDRNKTMVIFSNDMDKMLAAFIIANGAAAMGSQVTLFFTFWGLNLLRRNSKVRVKKTLVENMFGMMMPRGPGKTVLSKMHMGGMGTLMMRWVMRQKNVYSLTELVEHAQKAGIRLVACAMSMDIMGIKKEELIDGIEFGGVSYYLEQADNAAYNLFI